MSMEVVNGYVCRNCTDVEVAKRGVDPAKPQDDPKSPSYVPEQAKADRYGPAVRLSDVLRASETLGAAASRQPAVQASEAKTSGARVDISV